MISIVICSRTATISEAQRLNIEKTIGVAYELVIIDNSKNNYTIFEAYHLGVSRSKGSVLCFMHDDIFFHTENWGEKVYFHFNDAHTGAIGVAGSPYVPKVTGSWWAGNLVNQQLLVAQGDGVVNSTKYSDGIEETSKPVVVLDGIWLCIRKELFEKIKFDTVNFEGYHFYDIDICLQIFQLKYHLYCVFDIEIEHLSAGNVNEQWITNAISLHKKWKAHLPLAATEITTASKRTATFKTMKEFVQILIANNYSPKYSYQFSLKEMWSSNRSFSYESTKQLLYFFSKYLKSTFISTACS